MSALVRADASDLPAVIARARMLFDEGDVIAARSLASMGYDMARTAARFAVAEGLVRKAREMQGDAA